MDKQKKPGKVNQQLLDQIAEEIEKIQFGTVTVVIHDGRVVQLDMSSKKRLI